MPADEPPGCLNRPHMSACPDVRSLEIKARAHTYTVLSGKHLLATIGDCVRALPAIRTGAACAVISDAGVAPLYGETVLASLRSAGFAPVLVVFPAGETSKSWDQVAAITETLIGHGIDRHGFIVALGGGVAGDLAGFVASIYYRGIPCVQIPTTILAQVDSAIGGKTGINTVSGKNLVGSFHPPALVIVDIATLRTLPARVFDEGCAEVVKHAIIADRSIFEQLVDFERDNEQGLLGIIRRNLEIKAAIVAADEYERSGQRALLNFGHTIGHGIEQAGGYGTYLHGEAISLGIVAAARLSTQKAGLPSTECAAIIRLLQRFHLPTSLAPDLDSEAVLASLRRDKKFEAGSIRFVLTPAIGQARLSLPGEITEADIRNVIEGLRTPAS